VALFDFTRRLLPALLVCALLPGCEVATGMLPSADPYSEASFERWLAQDGDRQETFARFERFLSDQGVSGVVPDWQLLRTDASQAARCGFGAFAMPPEEKWPAIVPTLRLVEQEVIPVVGPVEVHSANRSDELNACIDGASRSRHLAFAAVDLVALERTGRVELFTDLCAMHRRVGARRGMGLGAYFDPATPHANRQGRSHIDQSGFRTWGSDYHRATSYCVTMLNA
jgi:hypothetical protein